DLPRECSLGLIVSCSEYENQPCAIRGMISSVKDTSFRLYAEAEKRGSEFIDGFLKDTARMTVEELGKKHLGVDLTQPNFWQEGVLLIAKDVEAFCTQ
nr:hypothetical protein [Chlamydiota bacterium]